MTTPFLNRVVVLDAGLLAELRPQDTATRWQEVLLHRGLLLDLPPDTGEAWTPQTSIHSIQLHLHAMTQTEEDLQAARAISPFRAGLVPPSVWGLMMALFFVMTIFNNVFWSVMLSAIILGVLAWVVLGFVARFDQHKRQRIQALTEKRKAEALTMWNHLQLLVGRTHISVTGSTLVVSTPHLRWLKVRLTDLGSKRPRPEGLESLEEDLRQAIQAIEMLLESFQATPPPAGTKTRLTVDLTAFEDRLTSVGVVPSPDLQLLGNALIQAGDLPASFGSD